LCNKVKQTLVGLGMSRPIPYAGEGNLPAPFDRKRQDDLADDKVVCGLSAGPGCRDLHTLLLQGGDKVGPHNLLPLLNVFALGCVQVSHGEPGLQPADSNDSINSQRRIALSMTSASR
jgi:hypothetical protein